MNIHRIAKTSALLAATLLAVATTSPVWAGRGNQDNPGVLPPQSHPHGMTYGEWAGAWWRWAFSLPAEINPVMDLTGEQAAQGQSGSVWFLAGTFGQTVTRTVTVPTGKALFFPIINQIWINVPELGDLPWSEEQEAYARSVIAPSIDNAVNLSCQIDGREVANIRSYRCPTPEDAEYMVTFPEEDSVWLPGGPYGPCVDDGIYLMLAPLKSGEHVIHFTAAQPDGSWSLDVTYNLTVR